MIILIIIVVLISPWFWSFSPPTNLFQINIQKEITEAQGNTTWKRGKVSPSPIDKLFLNWPKEIISRRFSIVMENLDIGNYFFAGHPRERVGIVEKQKFFFFEFIFLIVGLTSVELKKYKKFLIIYSLLMLLGVFIFEWREFNQTIFLSVPFIIVMALGLKKILFLAKNKLFK